MISARNPLKTKATAKTLKVIGVIPARYGSTRLAAKVLADLNGKPMIQHVYERAAKSQYLDELLIACDHERVLNKAKEFGAQAVLTSVHHASGTERIAEAVKSIDAEIVINIQGDEPLIHHSVIDDLAKALLDDSNCLMATAIKPVAVGSKELDDPNIVKVVIDKNHNALYFSRSLIPYVRKSSEGLRYFKHLGIYAYRKKFLMGFKDLPKSRLEETESLEQLRVLEAGYKIKTVETNIETISVDVEEDIKKVEEYLKKSSSSATTYGVSPKADERKL